MLSLLGRGLLALLVRESPLMLSSLGRDLCSALLVRERVVLCSPCWEEACALLSGLGKVFLLSGLGRDLSCSSC